MSGGRRAQLGVLAWCAGSVVLALLPPGAGGPLRSVDAALFMLVGPAVAGMVTTRRIRSSRPTDARRVPPLVEAVLWTSASIASLALWSTAIVVAGGWSTQVMVAVVAAETVLLALLPTRGIARSTPMPPVSGGARV